MIMLVSTFSENKTGYVCVCTANLFVSNPIKQLKELSLHGETTRSKFPKELSPFKTSVKRGQLLKLVYAYN